MPLFLPTSPPLTLLKRGLSSLMLCCGERPDPSLGFSDIPQQGVGRVSYYCPVEMKVLTPYLAFSDNTPGGYLITAG